ncbi:MAG: hypothetical protein COB50_00235 [Thiotrichales bacterium]|nr:MAG: hypothetical protein COB50_00235 [Thiotrichales bacterium]
MRSIVFLLFFIGITSFANISYVTKSICFYIANNKVMLFKQQMKLTKVEVATLRKNFLLRCTYGDAQVEIAQCRGVYNVAGCKPRVLKVPQFDTRSYKEQQKSDSNNYIWKR